MGKKKFRFMVGTKMGPRSNPWGLSISGSDIFVYSRSASGLWQFSFHEGGRSHLKVGSQRDSRGHEYVAIKNHPHDPMKLAPGEIKLLPLMTLSFFTNSLSIPENASALTKGTLIKPAPEGKITQLLLLRSRAPAINIDDTSDLASRKLHTIYQTSLANGETCYLMAMEGEGEFTGFKTPPSHGQRGWISAPADIPRYEYTGRITLLPNSDTRTYEVFEYGGSYFDEPEFSEECKKLFPQEK